MKRLLVMLAVGSLAVGVFAQGGLEQGKAEPKRTFAEAFKEIRSVNIWGAEAQAQIDALDALKREFELTPAEELSLAHWRFICVYRRDFRTKNYEPIIAEGRAFTAKYPGVNNDTANVLNYLANTLAANGELAEAESIWRSVLGLGYKFAGSHTAFWFLNRNKMITTAEKNGYLVSLIRELSPKRTIADENDIVWKALNEIDIPALGKDLDEARAKYRELLDYINLVVPATEENKAFIGFVESERDLKK